MPLSSHILGLRIRLQSDTKAGLVISCNGILLQSNAKAGMGGNYYYY